MVVFIMHLLSVAQTNFIYSFYLSHTHTQVKRLKCWAQNVQWDVTANDKGFSCPTGLPFKQTKHSCNLLPSLCISHIFNNYLLVTAATLNICGLDWWAPLVKRTCNHMMLTQPPCTIKTAFLFACDHTSFVDLKDSLSGWTSSCWGRRAICLERFASGSHTEDTLPMDTEPKKKKEQVNGYIIFA